MKIVTLTPSQFTKFANNHKYRNYYQTTAYGNTMVKFGYNVHYLGIVNDNNKLIGASLILYKEVFMSNKIAYAPRGILCDYEDTDILRKIVDKIKKVLGKQGFMLLRIDPYIPESIRDAKGHIINVNNQAQGIIKNLKKIGFSYKGKTRFFETEKPRWEALVLLNKNSTDIFTHFDKRVRTKIRRAQNSGLEVCRDKDRDIETLYEFIKKKQRNPISFYKYLIKNFSDNIEIYYAKINTSTFTINSRRLFEQEQDTNAQLAEIIQNTFLDPKERNNYLNQKMESDKLLETYKNNLVLATELLKTHPDGIKIAGAMVITYDNAAYVFIDGIKEKYSSLNANYLLKWYMIQDYNNRGFKYLNLNAVVGEFEEENKYSGLNEMKLGFNTTITEYLGEFDIILNNFSYNLYKSFGKDK